MNVKTKNLLTRSCGLAVRILSDIASHFGKQNTQAK